MPERFRYAHRALRPADEPPPPPAVPLDEAMARLLPEEPPEPHLLLPPDDLDDALDMADMLDGELPHWHRGRGDAETPAEPPPPAPELEQMLHPARDVEDQAEDEDGDAL